VTLAAEPVFVVLVLPEFDVPLLHAAVTAMRTAAASPLMLFHRMTWPMVAPLH